MDYRKEIRGRARDKVRFGKIDPAFKDKHESHDAARPEIQKRIERWPSC